MNKLDIIHFLEGFTDDTEVLIKAEGEEFDFRLEYQPMTKEEDAKLVIRPIT